MPIHHLVMAAHPAHRHQALLAMDDENPCTAVIFFPFSSGHLSGRMRDPGMVRHVYSATDREQDAP